MVYKGIQEHVRDLMKKQDPKANILKVVLGELQRFRKLPDDITCYNTIKKIIANNEEILKYVPKQDLIDENIFLKSLLPAELSEEEIGKILCVINSDILEAKSEGQATGIAMKLLKEKANGKTIPNMVVQGLIKNIRSN